MRTSKKVGSIKKMLIGIVECLAIVAWIICSSGFARAADITVGGKGFTEQLLIAEITSDYLTKLGYTVDKRDGMGSNILRQAQISGQVDLYWEYTGTSLLNYNKVKERLEPLQAYEKVKELDSKIGLVWLNPSKIDNAYRLAKRNDDTSLSQVTTISALANEYRAGRELLLASNIEFPTREDGLVGLQKFYDFKIPRHLVKAMDPGLTYLALRDKQADLALVFATDGRIAAFHFDIIEDDRSFFPSYWLVPVVKKETLERFPALVEQMNRLAALLDSDIMRKMNAEVDVEKRTIPEVAKEFLTKNNL